MTGFQPQTKKPLAADRRPVWRHPVALGLLALLLVLLFIRLVASDEPEPQKAPARSAQSPDANGSELQWPDLPVTTGPPAEPGSIESERKAPGRTFIAKLNLQPRMLNGRVKGYVVRPDDPSILAGTPLQPGDVLLEVDGLELDAARAAQLAQNVGDYQDVFVRFERGSVEQEDILPLGTR